MSARTCEGCEDLRGLLFHESSQWHILIIASLYTLRGLRGLKTGKVYMGLERDMYTSILYKKRKCDFSPRSPRILTSSQIRFLHSPIHQEIRCCFSTWQGARTAARTRRKRRSVLAASPRSILVKAGDQSLPTIQRHHLSSFSRRFAKNPASREYDFLNLNEIPYEYYE